MRKRAFGKHAAVLLLLTGVLLSVSCRVVAVAELSDGTQCETGVDATDEPERGGAPAEEQDAPDWTAGETAPAEEQTPPPQDEPMPSDVVEQPDAVEEPEPEDAPVVEQDAPETEEQPGAAEAGEIDLDGGVMTGGAPAEEQDAPDGTAGETAPAEEQTPPPQDEPTPSDVVEQPDTVEEPEPEAAPEDVVLDAVQEKPVLCLVDEPVSFGDVPQGERIAGIIRGYVAGPGRWSLTYTASDLANGTSSIPLSNITLTGTGLEKPLALRASGIIYEDMECAEGARYEFTHILRLSVPDDAEIGEYSGAIEYVLVQNP